MCKKEKKKLFGPSFKRTVNCLIKCQFVIRLVLDLTKTFFLATGVQHIPQVF